MPLVLIALALATTSAPAESPRTMAVTLDDLPVVSAVFRDVAAQQEITDDLLAALISRRVPAIGFVNESKLYDDDAVDSRRKRFLQRWLEAGMELGNHTFSHPDLHRVGLEEFLWDIERGERVTRPLLEARGAVLRYFRHPFLHTGRDLATRDAVVGFLAERGLRVAPVTIDNSEWIFARAYERALAAGDSELAATLAADYLTYMDAVVAFYEDQSRQILGREIPQILLLHANKLNADHLAALLDRLLARGYRFAPLDEVLEDPAYRSADRYTGPGGITWLHRWAITAEVDPDIFGGEPTVPAYVSAASGR